MAGYAPEPVPSGTDDLPRFLQAELARIAAAFDDVFDHLHLKVWNAEPPKPRDGRIYFADGTNWDPGSGRGYYGYSNSAWVFLG